MANKSLTPYQINQLQQYKTIWSSLPYGERAPELTKEDEKLLEQIYNDWRGTTNHILQCDECVEEAFDRLMLQIVN